jgi:hypothetical protein
MSWLRKWLCRLFGWFCGNPHIVSEFKAEIEMATATLSWTLPMTRDNGVVLDIGEIAFTAISMSADAGASFGPESNVLPTDPQTFVVDGLVVGEYLFRAVVVDTAGRRSFPAEVVGSVLAPPAAIADFTVVITD